MMIKALILIAGLAAVAAQTDVQGTLGVDSLINSGVDTRIAFGAALTNPSLRITATTSGGGQVTVRMSAQSTLALTGGWSSVSVGGTVGFSLVISGATTVTIGSLTLTGPGLTPTLITQITTGGYIAGVVQWSADSSAVVNLPIMQQPSLSSPNIVVQLPKVLSATYAFVSIQQTIAVPYGVVRECYAEANQTMTYTQSTAVELAVTFRARASSQLLIGRSTTSSTSASSRTEAGKSLGVYFNITLMGSASVNEYHDSEIRYYYTDAQCEAAGITAAMQAHLRLAYYNSAQARWVFPGGGRCDTQAKVVIQATSHFSEWGVFYNSAASTACSFALALAAAFLAMLAQ